MNKIAFIDDDADIQKLAKLALEKIGKLTVAYYSSGPEAFQSITSFNPDIILLDYMMPEWDGPMTFQKLRSLPSLASIPIIFMTAKTTPEDLQRYKELGAKGVIPKPFDPKTLATQVLEVAMKS